MSSFSGPYLLHLGVADTLVWAPLSDVGVTYTYVQWIALHRSGLIDPGNGPNAARSGREIRAMMLQGFTTGFAAGATQLSLVEEINHRVINEYCEAISSLSLAAARADSPGARDDLALAAERLRAHAETHRALLPPATAEVVDLTDYVARICVSLSRASLADMGVHIALTSDEIFLDAERCWRIGLILTELVRNAARHGLGGRAGSISIRIQALDGGVSCLVRDYGAQARHASRPGRGRRLVETLAAELGGSVDWRFTPIGCIAHFQMPIHGACAPSATSA